MLFIALGFFYTNPMFHKAFGAVASLASATAVSFFIALLQSRPNTVAATWFQIGIAASLVLAITAALGWFATRTPQHPSPTVMPAAAIVASDNASLVNPTAVHQSANINVGTINIQPSATPDLHVPPVAILDFSDPIPDDSVAIVDEQSNPHTYVRIWRVELRNLVEGTEATNVEVAIAESIPPLSTFPVELHRFHDDNPPYAQRHNLRHNAPITFDVIAKQHDAAEFFLWRSDLPRPRYTYIYHLSPVEREALFGNNQQAIIVLRAAATAPVGTKERAYGICIDEHGELLMEPLVVIPSSLLANPSNSSA